MYPQRGLVVLLCLTGWGIPSALAQSALLLPDVQALRLREYRTVHTALKTTIDRTATLAPPQPAFLGVAVAADSAEGLTIHAVHDLSPARQAGLRRGDVIVRVEDQPLSSVEDLQVLLGQRLPGDRLRLQVQRGRQQLRLEVTLTAPSRSLQAGRGPPVLGVTVEEDANGLRIRSVSRGSPAESVGLRPDDLIVVKVQDKVLTVPDQLAEYLAARPPGEPVDLLVRRRGQEMTVRPRLAAPPSARVLPRWEERRLSFWPLRQYRLAVVPVEFPDARHNPAISPRAWQDALFSEQTYRGKNATGQNVYGSLFDYYHEQSCGRFRLQGRVFDHVAVGKKRPEYAAHPNRHALLTEALERLEAREGMGILERFHGVCFLYAGERYPSARGGIFWPHQGSLSYQGRRWNYIICPEGGPRMTSISILAHEFGHLLGLPDLYAQPDSGRPEGLGVWCTMSNGHGQEGRPLHLSAWCKEQLGWLQPAVVQPTVKQRLILAPIEGSPYECFKVLVRPDGSEYFLLENRAARGFDRDLPGEGLLIWRVVNGRPVLEESHGLAGPEGPRRYAAQVPFPSTANNAFTPYTTPSSKSPLGGGYPVSITNIRRLPDGRITFHLGEDYL